MRAWEPWPAEIAAEQFLANLSALLAASRNDVVKSADFGYNPARAAE
jgi:hypothetical protein